MFSIFLILWHCSGLSDFYNVVPALTSMYVFTKEGFKVQKAMEYLIENKDYFPLILNYCISLLTRFMYSLGLAHNLKENSIPPSSLLGPH